MRYDFDDLPDHIMRRAELARLVDRMEGDAHKADEALFAGIAKLVKAKVTWRAGVTPELSVDHAAAVLALVNDWIAERHDGLDPDEVYQAAIDIAAEANEAAVEYAADMRREAA